MVAVRMIWGPAGYRPLGDTPTTQALNDADNAIGWLFVAPKTGNIDRVSFALSAEAGTSPAYNVGLTTVDASGNPTQTAFGGSSAHTQTFSALGYKTQTFSTPAAVTVGDVLAAHIWPTGSVPDGSNNITVIAGHGSLLEQDGALPGAKVFTTSWAATAVAAPAVGIRYDDGTWYYGTITDTTNATAFDSADTPDEYGVKFTVPVSLTVIGLIIGEMDPPATGDSFVVKLYDAADNVLQTITVDADVEVSADSLFELYHAPRVLAANAVYRIAITNSSAANTMSLNYYQFGANDQRSLVPEGASWSKTTRTDAGAWTDDDTMLPWIGLIVSALGLSTRPISMVGV